MSVTSPGPSQEPATFAANGDLHILGGNYVTNHITNQIYIDNERRPSGSRKNTAQALERLFQHCAQHAIHTSETVSAQGMCLGGTRTATIQHLSDHLASTDPNAHDILWFRGPAGGGKSAVMRTIASTLTNEPDTPGPPVASFFFFRADNRRNTASDFISTLAYQISCAWPSTQPFIAAAIQNDHTIFTQSLLRQARALLADPILRASEADPKQTFNPAMLIDGLDECTGPDSKKAEVVDALAAVATSIRKHGKSRIKILIASRPEHVIQSRFDLHARNNVASIFTLNPSDAELGLFFDTKLQEMREAHGLPEDWPSPKQRQILIDKTSGQYAFADTAMKYTAGGDPRQRLEKVLSAMSKSADPVQPLAPLYQLYAFVFAQIPPELLPKALDVVGAIIFNRNLSQPALTLLLDLPTGFFRQLSLYLSSLFDFHIDHWHTRVYHATLGDFLFNTAKSGQFNLYIDRRRVYTLLAEGFLSLPAKVSGDDARAGE